MSPKKTQKKASEMTDEELIGRIFPKKALDELKKIAQGEKPKPKSKS